MKGELLIMDLGSGVSQISSNNEKVKMRFIPKKVENDER